MRVRKTAVTGIVAIVALIGTNSLMIPAAAHAESGGSPAAAASAGTSASMSAVQKEKLLAKLKAAKQHVKQARKQGSQEAAAQAAYDAKLKDINRLIDKLNKSEDVNLGEVDKAVASPDSASK